MKPYAGFVLRAIAVVIDGFIVGVAAWVLSWFFGDALLTERDWSNFGYVLLTWPYFALLEASPRQATLGKQLLGIKVTDEAGRQISFARATLRHFAKFLSAIILMIGFIMAAFTERKQALHDKIADTLVVKAYRFPATRTNVR